MKQQFLLLATIALFGTCFGQAKVKVDLYYESLCPDSQAFFTQQLTPTMRSPLGKFVDLHLIPFGKSSFITEGSNTNFTCHHGENECYGNKIQACAIKNIESDSYQTGKTKLSKTVEFVNCLMSAGKTFTDSVYPTEKCGRDHEINNWKVIKECANNTEGSNLLKDMGVLTQTLKPELASVPTIVFHDRYEHDLQQQALINFQSTLCNQLKPTPSECMHLPGAATRNTIAGAVGLLVASILAAALF